MKKNLRQFSKKIINQINKDLSKNVDNKYKEGVKNFFKEEIKLYGVRAHFVKNISRKHFNNVKKLDFYDILKICEKLLDTNYSEDRSVAFDWAYRLRKKYKKSDFKLFEKWLKKYVSNWAACDDISAHIFGYFIEEFSELIPQIKSWSNSKNRWFRRASAVSFVIPARKGNNLKDVFEVAKKLLYDEDDLVKKGYGWMLKEASRKNQKQVFDFVMKHKVKMPRTALRYAIELMPDKLKKEAMKK